MIRLRILGTLDLTRPDGTELRAVLSQPRRVALLVYLAAEGPRGFHRRDTLIGLFWPDDDAEHARASLNRAIYFLRRELGDGVVVSRGSEEIGLDPQRFWSDVSAFEDSIDARDFAAALELYRGDLLPGFFASKASGFEHWLERKRAALRERTAGAAWLAATENESRGELALAVHWARRAVMLAPFDEVGVRRLLSLLDAAGDRATAVRSYQELVDRLRDELDVGPSPETRALIDDIRARERTNGNGGQTESSKAHINGVVEPEVPVSAPALSSGAAPFWRSRRNIWVATAASVLAVLTFALGRTALARARIDPAVVRIAPFVNRTDDPSLDYLGRVAANRITQSLSETGLLETHALDDVARADSRANVALPNGELRVDSVANAGTIITGEFHRESGRIVVQAWVTGARGSGVEWAVRPVSAHADSVGTAIDEVSSRATAAVAVLNMPDFAEWFLAACTPPTIEAFQEFVAAVELQSHGFDQDAVPHLQQAVERDSTFVWARMQLAQAFYTLFEQDRADSIANELNRHRERLNPLQRQWLAWMLSIRAEENPTGYRALKAASAIAPERFLYSRAGSALRLNRPRETIQLLKRLGHDSPHAGGPGAYWTLLTRAYHSIDDPRAELRAAREARRGPMEPMGALSLEISALAALGRPGDILALLDTAVFLATERGPSPLQIMVGIARISSPGQLMVRAAMELRAHGDEATAQEVLRRALAWYRAQPTSLVATTERRFQVANALYLSRDWSAADSAFRALAAEDPSNVYYLGYRGTIAARRHDETTARWVVAKFDSLRPVLPQSRRIPAYWQGKINAILGDEERALSLIREIQGPQGDYAAHLDFDLERLWHARQFKEFLRPKG